jgi:rhodanese-related sulfurtransferase
MMSGILKRTLYEATIVLLLSVGLCLAVTALRPGVWGLLRGAAPSEQPPEPQTGASRLGLDQAIQRFGDGVTLFADARAEEDFAAGHIDKALSLPFYQFDEWIGAFLTQTDPKTPIIAYCDGPHCDLGRELAARLAALGFETVFYLEDGWGQWQAKGLPTASGPFHP